MQSGAFLFPRLPVGSYELRVERPGFSRYVRTGITLTVDQAASLTVVMQVGQVSEEVTVEANTELVGTRNGTLGQLVDQQRVVELPLNGRMAQSLVFLAAGTVDLGRNGCRICGHGGVYPGEQTAGVNGAGMAQVNYQLDGAGHNDTYLNVNVPFPNPDAVQEFNLQASNFTAEYGNAAGGIVNIVTRSGTNEIRGQPVRIPPRWIAERAELLRADERHAEAEPVRRQRWRPDTSKTSCSISGPTRELASAAKRQAGSRSFRPLPSVAGTSLRCPCSSSIRSRGSRSSTIRFRPERISPVAKYFLDWIPLPNRGGRELNFVGTEQIETENQFMTKVEYNRRGHQISGRYFFTDYDRPAVIPKDNILAASSAGNAVRVQNVSVNHTFSIRPTLLLNSTFGFNRQRGGSLSSGPFSYPDAGVRIASAAASALKAPPELVMSVTGGFSINTNHLGDFDRGDFTIREDLTAVLGPHELHFGGEAVRLSNHIINTFRMDGNFTFNGQLSGDGLADFLLGRASSFVQGGGEFKDLKGTRWGFFAQDNWRAQSAAHPESGGPLGSVLPLLRPRGPRRLFRARREITAVPECACRFTVRRRRSRSRMSGWRFERQRLEHRSENRFRLPVDARTARRASAADTAISTRQSRRAPSTRLRTSRRSLRDSRSTACPSRIRSAAPACQTRFPSSTGRGFREPRPRS